MCVVSVCVCDYFLKTNKNKHRERVKAEEKFIWSFVVLVRDDCCWMTTTKQKKYSQKLG